jgi:cell division protein ZipA
MIQGIIAIVLLALAVVLFFWGRRPAQNVHREDPDVILGLTEVQDPKNTAPEPSTATASPAPAASISTPSSSLPIERQILFLRAPLGRPYGGYELLQSLSSCGLRFGEQNIFHRYEQYGDNNIALFSIASATKTGALNPTQMGEFTCQGLSLFVTLNQHVYPSVNFELMLDAARQLSEDLGGFLLDENQMLLTAEKVQQIREKIKNFETRQQTLELFA